MLKINHLKKNYPSFSLDCSLHVAPGCITGLIGQNGSGKRRPDLAVRKRHARTDDRRQTETRRCIV